MNEYMLLAKVASRVAQIAARKGEWERAAKWATRACDFMKKARWEQ